MATIVKTTNTMRARGIGPTRGCCPRASNHSGKSPMERSSSNTRASPRYMISVARVTTRDGRPITVIQKPLNAPPITPTSSPTSRARGMGTPWLCSQARVQAARPIMEATERSISALMMMKVMARATMIFSMDS